MLSTEKIAKCACGMVTETFCAGCGELLCNHCGSIEICSFDPDNIEVKWFCEKCRQDPKKNPWGTLYWQELSSLYS